tara:strand:+ start:186 stop:1577 length:1392 start_codon:yes stop_codon:yes gene_type:complete
MSSSEAAKELLHRRMARSGLHDFISYIKQDYIKSTFSTELCQELDEFYLKSINGERPVLIVEAPPQHGKSEIVSRMLPPYLFGLNPNLVVGGLSYGKDLASDMNRDIQRVMLSNEYKNLYPESSLNKKRVVTVEVEAKRNSDMFEIVGKKGKYISQGVGGPLTGKRLDIGIIDDPIKNSKEALSKTVKDSIWNWYCTVFLTRLSKDSGQIIMATRWATDDLSGMILDSNPKAKRLSFPAINDEGLALVPELHPIEKLMDVKTTVSSHFWSAMYQQSPTVLGGGIFKTEWWQYYTGNVNFEYRMMFADTAQKTGQENDFSVFQCWGKKDGNIYLIDQLRGKWEAPQLLQVAISFWNKHKASNNGSLRRLMIEDKSSGTGLIQQMKQMGMQVGAIKRNTDKVTRAYDTSPPVESRRVFLPSDASYLSDYLIEFQQFPTGKNDDQVDPTMDAIQNMLIETSGFIFA